MVGGPPHRRVARRSAPPRRRQPAWHAGVCGRAIAGTRVTAVPMIVTDNASKLFLDGAVVAFRQLSLSVAKNEIMCVVGPSGCGKTTLLRCIDGLTDLSSGKLFVHGQPVAGRPPDGVAMVFQHFGLLPWKTVY